MKRSALVLILLFLCLFAKAQTAGKRNYFAVGLFAGQHSSLITYAIVTLRDGEIFSIQVLSEQRFMYEAMGHYPSIANINKENLFAKNGVDSCYLLHNNLNKIVGYYCKPFRDLWKIRFYTHPTLFDTNGWSQGQYKPSRWQMQFLDAEYGVQNVLTDYFYGDSLFKILRDVQDLEWVTKYRYILPDTTASVENSGQP